MYRAWAPILWSPRCCTTGGSTIPLQSVALWTPIPLWRIYTLAGKIMGRAVELIREAIVARERVVIYGDYDVDGVTAVAVVEHCGHSRDRHSLHPEP